MVESKSIDTKKCFECTRGQADCNGGICLMEMGIQEVVKDSNDVMTYINVMVVHGN